MARLSRVVVVAAAALNAACDASAPAGPDLEDFDGVEELASPLTPLATPCTFATISGVPTMTVAVGDGETAVLARRAVDSAVLVNGVACGAATATTTKQVVVTGSSGTNVVIIDFLNGSFGLGYGTTPGMTIDLVSGSGDALRFRGGSTVETVTVGANGLALNADTVRDVVFSNVDATTFSLGAGNDVFSASGGYGTTNAYTGPVVVYGGDGNDILSGGTGADVLHGGAGNDTLRGAMDSAGDTADDELYGNDGDDTFDAGNSLNGNDTFTGGNGSDHVTYSSRSVAINARLGAIANMNGEFDAMSVDTEILTGTSGNDEFIMPISSGGYTANGGPGDDFYGHQGIGGGGPAYTGHTFSGGLGFDSVSYYWIEVGDVVASLDGIANDGTDGLDNVMTDIERMWGGQGNDTLTGGPNNDVLIGSQGNDTIYGLGGNDTYVESQDDGDDTYHGGAGVDTIDYSGRTVDVLASLDGVANDGADTELDNLMPDIENVLTGSGDDIIVGSDAANELDGGDGADILSGGAGNDILSGGGGIDELDGGTGDDILDGGAGTDTPITCGAGDGDIAVLGAGETASLCEL